MAPQRCVACSPQNGVVPRGRSAPGSHTEWARLVKRRGERVPDRRTSGRSKGAGSCGKGPSRLGSGQIGSGTVSQRFLGHNRGTAQIRAQTRVSGSGRSRGTCGDGTGIHPCRSTSAWCLRTFGFGAVEGFPAWPAWPVAWPRRRLGKPSARLFRGTRNIPVGCIPFGVAIPGLDPGEWTCTHAHPVPTSERASPLPGRSRAAYRASANSRGSKGRRSSTPSPIPI